MCGRITVTQTSPEALQQAFDLPDAPADIPPRYNVAPQQPIGVVIQQDGQNAFTWMRWGLIPSWAKDPAIANKLINARSETAAEKPSFRAAFKRRRCLVIADGFYEWRKNDDGSKTPMYIRVNEGELFGIAGLYEIWTDPASQDSLTTCTLLTTTPNDLMVSIHNRMPVILPRDDYDAWLDPAIEQRDQPQPLLRPFAADQMSAYPVSKRVNNARNDLPDLINPAPPPDQQLPLL